MKCHLMFVRDSKAKKLPIRKTVDFDSEQATG